MKHSLKNLLMIVMILASLIGGSFQSSPAEALGQPQEETLSLPSTWYNGQLRDVSGFNATVVFAVGYGKATSTSDSLPLIYERPNWTSPITPGLPGGITSGTLEAVWPASADVAYAVGAGKNADNISSPLIYRRSSGSWAPLTIPEWASWSSPSLEDVWGTSSTNVFAVGNGTNGGKTKALIASTTNGTDWAPLSIPDLTSLTSTYLYGVWGTSDGTSIFAVGTGSQTGKPVPLVYYSTNSGSSWTALILSSQNWEQGQLYAVWGSGPNDIYAVGSGTHVGSTELMPLVYRYQNSAWQDISSQLLFDEESGELFGVWGSSATDIYLAGSVIDGTKPLLYRRRATGSWAASSPLTTGVWGYGHFASIWGAGLDDIYMAGDGFKISTPGTRLPLLSHALEDTLPPGPVTGLNAAPGAANGTVKLTWTAPADDIFQGQPNTSNPASGPVDAYVVKYSTAAIDCSSGTAASQLPVPVAPGDIQTMTVSGLIKGTQYNFAVCAKDDASPAHQTAAATASGMPQHMGAGMYDDAGGDWVYSSGWTAYNPSSGPLNNTTHYTSTVNSSAQLQFIGTQFTLIYARHSASGSVNVYLDGTKVHTLDAYSSSLVWQASWSSPYYTEKTHTLRLEFTGPAGKYFDLDAVEVVNAPPPAAVGPGTYDDGNSNWVYSSGWTAYNGGGPFNNSTHYTSTVNSEAEFKFSGTKFALIYAKHSASGSVDVYVDGIKVHTLDAYSSSLVWQAGWTSPFYTDTTHTLRLVFTGPAGKYFDLDAIQIMNTAPPIAVGPGTYDDGNSNWVYSSGWTAYNGSGPLNNTTHYTSTAGSTAELRFTGVKFILSYAKHSASGSVDVYVDGIKVGTINAYSSSLVWQAQWASPAPAFTNTAHTLQLVFTGPAGKYFDLDAIQILDSLIVPAGTYDDADSSWVYTSGWAAYNGGGPFNSSTHYTSTVNSEAVFQFTGTKFTLIYAKHSASGSVDVYLDGTKVHTLDAYSSSLVWQAGWTSSFYANTTHTLRLVFTGPAGKYFDLDAIQIMNTAPPAAVGPGTYDDGNSNWVYSSGWTAYNGSGPLNSTTHYTNAVNSTADLRFTGTKFTLIYAKHSASGSVDVYVDGIKVGTINAYSSSLVWQASWTSSFYANTTHTLQLVFTGPAGKYFDLDAIQIVNTPPPAAVPPGTYDDGNSNWVYSSGWTAYNGGGPLNNSSHYTSTVGSYAELRFTGLRFIVTFAKDPSYGLIDVYVDGIKVGTIDAYSPATVWQATWIGPALNSDPHTVRFVFAGPSGKYIDLDSIQILSSAAAPAGNYDDGNGYWSYSSGWTAYMGSGPLNNTSHYTSTVDTYAEFKFTGTHFILTYAKYPTYGSIYVTVDGNYAGTIDASNPSLLWQATWPSPSYTYGEHTARFKFIGPPGTYVDLDSIYIP